MRGVIASAADRGNPVPFVTIVVPTLNEEHYIGDCLSSLAGQWPLGCYEILVMDGGSTDRTAGIAETASRRDDAIVVVANPGKLQSAAMNLAARIASPRATVLVRADAHALYPPDFIQQCVDALLLNGATSVVVPMHNQVRPGEILQAAIAAAQSSRLGNGGAAHRTNPRSGFVEHGHHAVFDLAFFRRIGGYDESFTHNEDAELDVRAIKAGGRIWMCAGASVTYYPRDRFGSLARQYFRHGAGRARTLRKHRLMPKPRQMMPVAALACSAGGLIAAPFLPVLAVIASVYPAICLAWGGLQTIQRRDPRLLAGGAVLMTMHLAWATGFLTGGLRRVSLPAALKSRSFGRSRTPIASETL